MSFFGQIYVSRFKIFPSPSQYKVDPRPEASLSFKSAKSTNKITTSKTRTKNQKTIQFLTAHDLFRKQTGQTNNNLLRDRTKRRSHTKYMAYIYIPNTKDQTIHIFVSRFIYSHNWKTNASGLFQFYIHMISFTQQIYLFLTKKKKRRNKCKTQSERRLQTLIIKWSGFKRHQEKSLKPK